MSPELAPELRVGREQATITAPRCAAGGTLVAISPCDETTEGELPTRDLELTLKAAGDPTRTRILKLLEGGGLCVCQVQAVLGLAPSTVSKHLSILKLAGLVEDRRDGKWIEYALSQQERHQFARPLLAMLGPIDRDPIVIADRKRLREVKAIPIVELCNIPSSPGAGRTLSHGHWVWSGRGSARGKARGGRAIGSRPRP